MAIAGPPREQVVGKPVGSVFHLIRTFVMHKPFQDFCLQVEEVLSTLTEATKATRWTPEQWQRGLLVPALQESESPFSAED